VFPHTLPRHMPYGRSPLPPISSNSWGFSTHASIHIPKSLQTPALPRPFPPSPRSATPRYLSASSYTERRRLLRPIPSSG